jgi:hypothetical protein
MRAMQDTAVQDDFVNRGKNHGVLAAAPLAGRLDRPFRVFIKKAWRGSRFVIIG